jgi:hypothetical protein
MGSDDAPDYAGSTPVEIPNLGAPGTDSRSGNARAMETEDSPAQVAAFYRDYFQRTGMTIRADTANDAGGLITAARDGRRGVMLTVSRVGAKTRIAIIRGRAAP